MGTSRERVRGIAQESSLCSIKIGKTLNRQLRVVGSNPAVNLLLFAVRLVKTFLLHRDGLPFLALAMRSVRADGEGTYYVDMVASRVLSSILRSVLLRLVSAKYEREY